MVIINLLWGWLLYFLYNEGSIEMRRIFSILLLVTPGVIIYIDRPSILSIILDTIIELILLIVLMVSEKISQFFDVQKGPKIKNRREK